MKKLSRFDIGMIIAFTVVALLGGGAWYYLSGQLATALQKVDDAKRDFDKYSSKQDYLPTTNNVKTLQENIDLLKAQLDPLVQSKLQNKDSKLAEVKQEEALAWKRDMDAEVARLTAAAKSHGVTIPPEFHFGFSRYLKADPDASKTIGLTKQMIAIGQISDICINSPVKAIYAIKRTYDEGGGEKESGGGQGKVTEALGGHVVEAEGGVYTAYPLEFEIEATTDSLRRVLNDLLKSPYVFVVRSIVIQNSKLTSPQIGDLDKMVGTPGPSVVDSSPGEVAASKSTQGPQYLFGGETLHIKMRIDMIEWNGVGAADAADESKQKNGGGKNSGGKGGKNAKASAEDAQ